MLGESKKQLRTQIKKLLETIPSESKKLQSTQVTSKVNKSTLTLWMIV